MHERGSSVVYVQQDAVGQVGDEDGTGDGNHLTTGVLVVKDAETKRHMHVRAGPSISSEATRATAQEMGQGNVCGEQTGRQQTNERAHDQTLASQSSNYSSCESPGRI